MAVNASVKRCRVVSSIRLMASLVCVMESRRSLRWVVRKPWRVSSSSNCSIAIMFTGPSRSIFARSSAIASSALSVRSSAAHRLRGGVASSAACRRDGATAASPASIHRRPRRPNRRPRESAHPVRSLPSRSSADDFLEDVVERRLHRVDARLGKVRQVALGRGPRDVELRDPARARPPGPTRALLIAAPARRSLPAPFRHGIVGLMDPRTRASSSARTSGRAGPGLRLIPPQARRARWSVSAVSRIGGERRLAQLRAPSRLPRAGARLRAASAWARSTSAACDAPASALRRLRSCAARAPRTAGAARRSAARRRAAAPRRAAQSTSRASSWRRSSASRSSSLWRRSTEELLAGCCSSLLASSVARCSCAS